VSALNKHSPDPFGLRIDNTKKGKGYFGVLNRKDGGISTEISIGIEMDGKEIQIPTLVPTLDKTEIDYLLNQWKEGDQIPKPIVDKAVDHAKQRMMKGLSPFAD